MKHADENVQFFYISRLTCIFSSVLLYQKQPLTALDSHCLFLHWTRLTHSCLQRGTGRDQNPRRRGEGQTTPNATLSPPE